jgi:hypothetical protein
MLEEHHERNETRPSLPSALSQRRTLSPRSPPVSEPQADGKCLLDHSAIFQRKESRPPCCGRVSRSKRTGVGARPKSSAPGAWIMPLSPRGSPAKRR